MLLLALLLISDTITFCLISELDLIKHYHRAPQYASPRRGLFLGRQPAGRYADRYVNAAAA